jgi:hypothetical protein
VGEVPLIFTDVATLPGFAVILFPFAALFLLSAIGIVI